MNSEKQRVAVIGGGIAGIVAAWRLSKRFDVSIFEAGSYLGGHTNTVIIPDGPDIGTPIDTGFIVLNNKTYPQFTNFLNELNVDIRDTDMSFSVYCSGSDLQYCSRDANVLFAQRRNVFNPRFLRMLLDIRRFWNVASAALKSGTLGSQSLAEFLRNNNFGKALKEDFLYPLAAAVWSSSDQNLDNFPAQTFLTFFKNHGWLSYVNQPRWQTVLGGSFQYIRRFQTLFNGTINLDSAVLQIRQNMQHGGQEILLKNGRRDIFDLVVIATHADQVLPLLKDASQEEIRVFASWSYSKNYTVLHSDASFMPPLRRAWGAWNYRKEPQSTGSQSVSVTYYMNQLQGLTSAKNYFVTLNPRIEPHRDTVIKEVNYTHPIFSSDSVKSQSDLQIWNGSNGRWYCGSYCGYGFHEDAVRAAEQIVNKILS